jgi:hypothetical protein
MKAFKFTTTVTLDRKLIIPEPYIRDIPAGDIVQVIILIGEETSSASSEEIKIPEAPTLEDIINEIKNSPQNPANVQAASGLLAEHLMNSPEIPEPSFDVAKWNREWDAVL